MSSEINVIDLRAAALGCTVRYVSTFLHRLAVITSMWVRKSSEQIARDRRRLWLSPRWAMFWFLLALVCFTLKAMQSPHLPGQYRPLTLSQIFFGSAVAAFVVALVIYVMQLILKRRVDPGRLGDKVVICDSCHRVKHPDGESKCECGGTFDDFDNWTWIEGGEEEDWDEQ